MLMFSLALELLFKSNDSSRLILKGALITQANVFNQNN